VTPSRRIAPTTGAVPIRAQPDAASEQVDQLLFGEAFGVDHERGDWLLGRALRDGYVVWVEAAALADAGVAPTHRVRAVRTVLLEEPSARAAARFALPMNALVTVEAVEGRFARLEGGGWIASGHLAETASVEGDPAAVAEAFLGLPYEWGGRGLCGVDCSGLVQAALYACGRDCPRDSKDQASLGRPIEPGELSRGDLVLWPGHIGLMLDETRLIHASGVHMAVVVEPLADAIAAREADIGSPSGFRRL
jgi:cell wall-associated NlpC family hydrolase